MPPVSGAIPAKGAVAPHESTGAPAAKPAKPVPPQFQKSMSGLDDLGDYLEKAYGGERSGHKYIRRTGAPGSYEYVYAHPKTGEYRTKTEPFFGAPGSAAPHIDKEVALKREQARKERKQGFGQQSLPWEGQPPAAPGTLRRGLASGDRAAPASPPGSG